MALTKIRIGDYFQLFSKSCDISDLTCWDVSGVNRQKEFFEPSTQVGTDTSKYKIVPPQHFACNLMHVGRDKVLPIAFNHTTKNKIVSPAYFVFKIKNKELLLQEYFFVMLKSVERDRYFWFHTDGSVRDGMAWNEFCDLEIQVPSIEVQQKYVDIYNAMVANQKTYEKGLDDLKLVCDGYIEDLRRNMHCEKIGRYISEIVRRNEDSETTVVKGVEASGQFIKTKANMQGVEIDNYTIVTSGNIAYNPSRINLGSIALYQDSVPCIVSPMYEVFEVNDTSKILPEYLMLWLQRKEFFRYTWYYAQGSVRDTFDLNLMRDVAIPIPDIKIQQSIVDIYNQYIARKEINEKLKTQIKDICPILIKGSLHHCEEDQI